MNNQVFNRILYGGDYNPNQWEEDIWQEDMRIFKQAAINSATINVFSWAKIQPSENEYDFEELDKIIEMLSAENYDIVLATSTAALPAWLVKKYPEVTRTDFQGRVHKFGQRHNACPNSLVYQKYSAKLAGMLAQRYGNNSHVTCWHINNEYGGECFCDNCEKAFRVWLKDRYKTLEQLNSAWNTEFWGHTIYDWDEIVVPNELSEGINFEATAFAGISLDYRRFNSDSILANYLGEKKAIREFDEQTPVTTNLMGTYKALDYFKWAKELDIVSWDNYPSYNTPWSYVAMCHDLMRGLKGGQPFMLMEQTPSQQNWQPYNSLKRPGQMRAQSYQTLAHGADTIQFFQLRRSKGACEKFHGAVIAHSGHENTRVFREVAQLGHELTQLDSLIGARTEAAVGLIFDWDNYWALEYTSGPTKDLKYVDQIHQFYRYFYDNNIPVDLISVEADFSKYDLVVAPVLYLVNENLGSSLTEYVAAGGNLITTYMSGIVDESDNVHLGGYPGPLKTVAGIWVEEVDALAPNQTNSVELSTGEHVSCNMLCDIIHLEGAEAIGRYCHDFYADTPAVTRNNFEKGHTWYFGTQLSYEGLSKVLDDVSSSVKLNPVSSKTPLEVTQRKNENGVFTFILNLTADLQTLPVEFADQLDLLTKELTTVNQVLKPWDVIVLQKDC